MIQLALFVKKLDNAIHWINLYPLDIAIIPSTNPLDSDLSNVWTT